MDWMTWYNSLAKPSWTPQPSTIGTIWGILYPVIVVTFAFVFVQWFRGKLTWREGVPFAINLASNLLFSPIQFTLRNNALATVDIMIIWGSLIWMIVAIWPRYRLIAIAQVPYFIWVSIASVLQVSITIMNWSTH